MTEEAKPDEEVKPPGEGAETIPPEQEQRIVGKVVDAVKDGLRAIVEDVIGTTPDPAKPAAPSTPAGIEDDLEAKVGEALEKIGVKSEAETQERVGALEGSVDDLRSKVEAVEKERKPVQASKLSRALWGGGS